MIKKKHSLILIIFIVLISLFFIYFFYINVQTDKSVYRTLSIINNKLSQQNIFAQKIFYTKDTLLTLKKIFFSSKPKKFLLLLLNNNELRPGGGFIGSFGILELKLGRIQKLYIDDVYNLDILAYKKRQIIPPKELQKYLQIKAWYLRDANWNPDFSISSQKVLWFYKYEKGVEDFDGVIAVNPIVIGQLLDFVGGIEYDGIVYNSSNLAKELQFKVEKEFVKKGIPLNKRKQILNILANKFVKKAKQLKFKQLIDLLIVVQNNLENKNVMIYMKDSELQKILENKNWAGKVNLDFNNDYLMIVDANLASLKTDSVMIKKVFYKVKNIENKLISELEIHYKNTGNFTWKTTRYQSFSRIYIPKDSKIIYSNIDWKYYDKNLEKHVLSFYIVVEPGQEKIVKFKYELPNYILDKFKKGKYQFFIQKQSGNNIFLMIDFNFSNVLKSMYINNVQYNFRDKIEMFLNKDLLFNFDFK